MKRHLLTLLLTLVLLPLQAQQAGPASTALDPYRPWVRWWWNGDKVEKQELVRELQLLKEAGIGGVEINPIEFPAKRCDDLGIPSLTWLSDPWLDALEVTLQEAKRLGMGCDLLVGSGWPFGTETLPREDRAQVILVYSQPIPAGETFTITKDSILKLLDPQVTVPNEERIGHLVALYLTPDTISYIDQVKEIPIPAGDTITIEDWMIRRLEDSEDGSRPNSQFSILNSQLYLYALVRYESFASVINGAPGAAGPILDHMNADAVQRYLDNMSHTLERRLGPMKNWLRAYFVDSMELEGSNWTSDFAEQFRQRRGYDITPFLPLILFKVGRLGEPVSYHYGAAFFPWFERRVQRARHDFELTKAELLHERYTQTFLNWCHQQGVKARAQAYGRGFFPFESSLGYDIPEGESWTTNYLRHRVGYEMPDDDYRRGRAYTMINKYVSSAAHLAGNRLVSAEEMTNTYMLFNTPLELLKVGSDMSAFSGVTHSVWHGFNYSPREAGFPGWVQYGSYLNEQNTLWPYFHLLNEYRARMSAMLQNADMQTDIAIIPPIDQLWAEYGVQTEPFPNYPKGSIYQGVQLLWEAVHKNGGNCDLVSGRVICKGVNSELTNDCGCHSSPFTIHGSPKQYKALLVMSDSYITLQRPNKPDVYLPIPDSNHYLEWYAQVQQQYLLPHAVEIDQPNRFLLQNHYKNDAGDDLFFFANASLERGLFTNLTFPKKICRGRHAWLYDPATDTREPLFLTKGETTLCLGPAETKFIIFNREKPDTYAVRIHRMMKKHNRVPIDIWPLLTLDDTTPCWDVHLHHAIENRDTTLSHVTLKEANSLLNDTSATPYAGTITYTTLLNIDSSQVPQQPTIAINTRDICELYINGHHCGTRWFGRGEFRIPEGVIHSGENHVEIKLTTLLNNYVHTLTDDKVIQHFVLKRNIPYYHAGLNRVTLYPL